MKYKIVNPHNTYLHTKNNVVPGRGGDFYSLVNIGCYRRFSLHVFGTSYKGLRIVICKRVLSIE